MAMIFHAVAKMVMGLQGTMGRLIRFFYYAFNGSIVCTFLISVLPFSLIVPESFALPLSLLVGVPVALYTMYVGLQLIRENYSIKLSTAFAVVLFTYILFGLLGLYVAFFGFLGFKAFSSF